jgi:hypothetical protein
MRKNHPMGRITARDILRRESSLLDYAASWLTQSEQLMNVISLSCRPLSPAFSQTGILLASHVHKMATLSQSLSCAANINGVPLLDQPMNYSSAFVICWQHLAEKEISVQLAGSDRGDVPSPQWTP